MKAARLSLLSFALAGPLAAHPHIFVDTGLDLHFDAQGRLTGIRVIWEYDEFYSLLITEDKGLDPDFDGVLTPAELETLQGFDMQWTPGFNGDLVVLQDGKELALSGPMEATASFEDGRITTTHLRHIRSDQTSGVPIELKPYDATYYTAYDITRGVRIDGNPACHSKIDMPDIDARLKELQGLLATLDTETAPEDEGLPDIGGLLATTVRVTCDVS